MSRKPSSHNYKRLSNRVRESTIETHVSAPRPSVGHRKGANQRYARSAVRGEIHQVLPNTTTREDRFAYEARMNRRSYVERNVAAIVRVEDNVTHRSFPDAVKIETDQIAVFIYDRAS